MKRVLTAILVMVFVFMCAYMMGSFFSATLDIEKWREDLRAFVAFGGGIISIVCAVAYFDISSRQNS